MFSHQKISAQNFSLSKNSSIFGGTFIENIHSSLSISFYLLFPILTGQSLSTQLTMQ